MIENARIENVSLTMENCGCLTLELTLKGNGWQCVYGGYCLGKGYLGSKTFRGSEKGLEAIMRIMNTIGVETLENAVGKIIRVESSGWGGPIIMIGHVIEDRWFSYEEFFKEEQE